MGVPKFFRYISERYPCLSELAREQFIPEFDNLYLDMNGIIHNCSHPDDSDFQFHITEEEMFKDIFNYIDKLFFLIKPEKLFFMAIDGVAPRAKMNQQRSRRFRSAKEAETMKKSAANRGEIREHEFFDSNCITPGTEFMDRLHEALRYFIKSKISSDRLWQRCRVILSGHNCPGEGEHKIMDYIRYLKSQKDFNPNTRHCLYGLDADLIILGLCTHELHFVVLREEVKFGKKNKKASVEETRFFLLHLALFREYLEIEFDELKHDPNFDIANLIDDWVLMGFLVGNDFIPHLPCMHISSNALPLLYKTYKKVYSTLGGNINENGKLNLPRLEKYFEALAEVEFDLFQENLADFKYFDAKQSKNGGDCFDCDVDEILNSDIDDDLAALIKSSGEFLNDDEDLSDEEGHHVIEEFENYKRNYYMSKLHEENSDSEYKRGQAIGYVTALQWILDYYYRGVQSWGWFYPHHYAPFISDLKNFKDYEIKLEMGKPFLPFEQLLAVLPAASQNLLPVAYRGLMTSASSEVIDFYPQDFETDLNGKQQEWEAVVLIPFIDENLLLGAMEKCHQNLTAEERKRNTHGPMMQYDYCTFSQGQVQGIYSMKALYNVFCTEKPIYSKDITVSAEKTVCVELPNADRSVFFSGFPTMKHLDYKFDIRSCRVKVFDFPSRNESVILRPELKTNFVDIYIVAEKFLNQIVYIGWPHLVRAKVIGISNIEKYIDADGIHDIDPKVFNLHVRTAKEHSLIRMGIEFEDISVMVHAQTYTGISYICGSQGKVNTTEIWSTSTTAYPAQGVVYDIPVNSNPSNHHKKIEQLFPSQSCIFFVGNPYYGSQGIVMNPLLVYECGRLQVSITVLPEPDFTEARIIQANLERDYINSYQAAVEIGIQVKCLARLTGSVLVVKGARRTKADLPENLSKINIGLQFKYFKTQEMLVGYTRRQDNQWFMSSKAMDLIRSYAEKFPMVIEYLSTANERNELLFEQDIFPNEVGEGKIEKIAAWLKEQPHTKADRISCGSKTMEKESVEKLIEAIEELKTFPVKTVKLQVKPHLLLKPDVSLPSFYKPTRDIQLFDRVVIVKTTYMVPLGSKGTVIGIYPVSDPNPVRLECVKSVDNFYEVLFDREIPHGNDVHGIAPHRVYKVPESSVLLIYTQGRHNDQFIEAKKAIDMEEAKNIAFTSSSLLMEANGSNSSSALNKSIANDVAKMPQLLQKGGSDFWMPAVNSKIKHSTENQLTKNMTSQNEKPFKILQKPLNDSHSYNGPTIRASQECNDGTQVLKSMLGLDANAQNLQSQPILNMVQLPQPPPSWRSDAQRMPVGSANYQRMLPPLFAKQNAPVAAFEGSVVPLPTTYSQINMPPYRLPPHSRMNHHHMPIKHEYQLKEKASSAHSNMNHHHMPIKQEHQLKEKASSALSSKSINSLSNEKGAFIPLQVARGLSHKQKTGVAAPPNNVPHCNELAKEITKNIGELDLNRGSTVEGLVTTQIPNNTDPGNANKPHDRKKPPRVPKIGAKFDFAK